MMDILDMLQSGNLPQQPMGPGMTLAAQNSPYTNDIGLQNFPAQAYDQQDTGLGDPKTLSNRIQQALGAKPQNNGDIVQQILSQRMQPSLDDISQGAVQTLFKGSPVSGQMVADENIKNRLEEVSSIARIKAMGAGGNTAFAARMQMIQSDPEMSKLPVGMQLQIASGKVGTNLTVGSDGTVTDMSGAAQGLSNLKAGEMQGQKNVELQMNPQIAGAEATAKTLAEKSATQKSNLPVIAQNTAYAQDILKRLVDHPGLPYATGAGALLPTIPGTSQADFKALRNQINGVAFLQAFQTLRGGGQISNVEGDKATSAITRLNDPKISPEAFKTAANELYNILDVGLQRAKGEASGNFDQSFGSQDFNKDNMSKGRVVNFNDLPE